MLKTRFAAWASKRATGVSEVTLGHNNLYIIPSLVGAAWLALFFLVWVGAANYDNNPGRFLAWWMLAAFFVTMFRTQQGLLDAKVKLMSISEAEVGHEAEIKLHLKGFKSEVLVGFDKRNLVEVPAGSKEVTLSYRVPKRGFYQLDPLRVVSYQPLGLFRCWSQLRFQLAGIGYPKLVVTKLPPLAESNGENDDAVDEVSLRSPGNDYAESRPYQTGEPMSRIDWKAWAKTDELFTKHFGAPTSRDWLLDGSGIQGDLDTQLGVISYWVLRARDKQWAVGVSFHDLQVPLGADSQHYDGLLKSIAVYGEVENE